MLKSSMHLLVFINLVFAATTFSLLYFAGRKIQAYVLTIYAYAPALQELESVLSENVSMADLDKLNESMAVVSQSYKMILIITLASMGAFFLVWCFFQSMEWKISYRSLKKSIKLDDLFDKDYLRYSLRLGIVTIPAFMVIFPSFYYFTAQIKALFLQMIISMYGLGESAGQVSYFFLIMLFLIILFTSYFTIITYVLLNRHELLESVKRSFKTGLKKIYALLPIHFACLILIIGIIYLDSYLANLLEFKVAVIISLLVYFSFIAYYQVLMVSLLEKE